jgi:hypothetical protein
MFKMDKFVLELGFLWLKLYTLAYVRKRFLESYTNWQRSLI